MKEIAMYKLVNLVIFALFFSVSLFSIEIDISWNKRIYKLNPDTGFKTSGYQSVSEIDFGTYVEVIAKWDGYIHFNAIIFRLYYDDDICIFQKSIFGWNRFGHNTVNVECFINAEKEYIEQMQTNDSLYYKCSFEFPSGEIIESESIKATFSHFISYTINNVEDLESFDMAILVKSDDNEYYKILNFRENGYFEFDNPWHYRTDGLTSVFLKFENLLPGKVYSIEVVGSNTRRHQILFDGVPFYDMPFL
jgi:hypothetical protein